MLQNTRWSAVLAVLSLCGLIMYAAAVQSVQASDADGPDRRVRLTFNNRTSQKVLVAISYVGFDTANDRKVGWYAIAPGKSKKIVLPKEIDVTFTLDGTGYYAKSVPGPGQKKLQWTGKFMKLSVGRKRFNCQREETIKDGWTVGFRKIKLKRADEYSGASATINLKE